MKKDLRIDYVDPPVKSDPGERWAIAHINANSPYYVSTQGRIYSVYSGRLLKLKLTDGTVMLDYTPTQDKSSLPAAWKKEKKKTGVGYRRRSLTLQRIVAHTFIPRPPKCTIVIHKDHDKLNNAVTNLEWREHGHVMKHARDSPNYNHNGAGKLTEEFVREIKELLGQENHPPIKDIASMYNVSEMQIFRIQNGDNWKHVPGFTKDKQSFKLSTKTITQVRDMLTDGYKNNEIARELGVSEATVSRIKNGGTRHK
jgi:hypothetical protein